MQNSASKGFRELRSSNYPSTSPDQYERAFNSVGNVNMSIHHELGRSADRIGALAALRLVAAIIFFVLTSPGPAWAMVIGGAKDASVVSRNL
jgi:hypothetical protein